MRLKWRHVTVNAKSSWLHGDARGFRSRRHRIHCWGDYKHRPPVGEHERLLAYQKQRTGAAVEIPQHLRELVGRAFLRWLEKEGYRVLVLSVSNQHVHL